MLNAISKFIYKNIPTKLRWGITCVSAFIGFALLFNTNSYHADKNNLNTAYLVVGIVCVLISIAFIAVAATESASKSDK